MAYLIIPKFGLIILVSNGGVCFSPIIESNLRQIFEAAIAWRSASTPQVQWKNNLSCGWSVFIILLT